MKKLFTMMFFIAAAAGVSLADVARPTNTPKPGPAKQIDTYLRIELNGDAKEARLIIPRDQVRELRAQLDAIDTGDASAVAGITDRNIPTIVSGIFLSAAFVFAGIWFARSGRSGATGGKAAAAGIVLLAGGAFVSIAYANAGPPAEARSITGKMFTRAVHIYKFGGGKIKLEVSPTETVPKLIVPDNGDVPAGEE